MKNKNIKIALFAMGATAMVSCSKIKDFGDTNVNPSAITTPTTYAILTNVESGITGYILGSQETAWTQQSAESQYPSEGLYDITATYYSLSTYSGNLLNLRTIIQQNRNADEVAAARVLTQYIYWQLTDNLGDIPYSQAFASKTPAYDKQQDIYKGMIAELKAAKAQFVNTGGMKGDILMNNNVPQWVKFANSLRAMMAIQLTKKYPAASDYAATEFKAAIADGVITSNTDNVGLAYVDANFKNPYWSNFDGARDNGESKPIFDMLAALGDGRQAAIGTSNIPLPQGVKEATINAFLKANPGWSHMLGASQRLVNSTVWLLTASQLYLARAEAAARGWTLEDKTAMLQAGVNASFAQFGLALPPASYFTQGALVLDGSNDVKKIAEQAYIACFPNGKAAWNIWRRTGYPALTPAPDPLNAAHTTIPRRYTFVPASVSTFSEYNLNAPNLAAAIATLSPATDTPESKIWWDQ